MFEPVALALQDNPAESEADTRLVELCFPALSSRCRQELSCSLLWTGVHIERKAAVASVPLVENSLPVGFGRVGLPSAWLPCVGHTRAGEILSGET